MTAPKRYNRMIFTAAGALLLAAFGISLLIGAYPLTAQDILSALSGGEGMAVKVFWRLRLPRSLASAVCVFGLAYAAFLLYPYSLLFVVVILPVTMSVLSLTFLWDPLDELVFENCTDEQESGDEKKQDENL